MFIFVVVVIFPARQRRTVKMSWIPVYVWWLVTYAVLRAKWVFFTMTYSSRCVLDKCADQEKADADAHALWHRLAERGVILQKSDDMDVKAMMMSSNEKCSTLLALCEGNPKVTGEFPTQKPVTWSFDIFFDLRLNKWLNKQS